MGVLAALVQIKDRLQPFLASTGVGTDSSAFLIEFLLRRVKTATDGSGLAVAQMVVNASQLTSGAHERLVKDVVDVAQLVVDAAYHCPVNGENSTRFRPGRFCVQGDDLLRFEVVCACVLQDKSSVT